MNESETLGNESCVIRCWRFLSVLPAMFSSPYAFTHASREFVKLIYRQGWQGIHTFRQGMEARRNNERSRRLASCDADQPGYLIYAPPYTSNSAGIKCLYLLCHEMNVRGFPSFVVNSYQTAPQWIAPLIGWTEARRLARQGYVAVYPETVVGNPLRARVVARWVLNRPGWLGGRDVYDDTEIVFNYSNLYQPYIRNRIAGKLHMPVIDESIFFCNDGEPLTRTLECFYVGKSTWKEGVVNRTKAFEITRRTPPRNQLGNLFRSARLFYCFDNSTALIHEALLCGCPVMIIPDGTQKKDDLASAEMGFEGIAWGPEELPLIKMNVPKIRQRYEQIKQDFLGQLDQFIALTHPKAA
jgi:hypothetical protein